MKLLMLGTGPFAAPTFQSLIGAEFQVAALITRPARGRKPPPNPMREIAETRGVSVHAPDDINSDEGCALLKELAAELLVVCDYGQILSPRTLETTPLGGINLHGSLLPKYRGAAPVNWAIYHGEPISGVTVIHMTPRLDAGPCLTTRSTTIAPKETAEQLEPRLAELGVEAVHEALAMLDKWDRASPIGVVQSAALATRAPRLKKSDGQVDWTQSAAQIARQVRAFKPWPGTFTHWQKPGAKQPLRLILDRACAVEGDNTDHPPGEIAHCDGKHLAVAAGDGLLAIERIQPAGKRVMQIDEFLRGHPMKAGERMGS